MHPDFYKDMASVGSMLKSPDLETERMNQGRSKPMERGRDGRARPHSVHYSQHNGEADSDKENQAVPARGQMVAKAWPGHGHNSFHLAFQYFTCTQGGGFCDQRAEPQPSAQGRHPGPGR